jgi:ubiquinone/menaquinone biosynthesis C-methylase UbiE
MAHPLSPEAEVLDIGCATGEITYSLHERFRCKTVGLDISANMIVHCREKFVSEGLRFEAGDILDLPFNNEQFDLVVSMSVIEWIQDYKKGVAEVSRALKPGGQWIVSIPNWKSPVRKLEYLKSLFTRGSYLRHQKNRISVSTFESIAAQYGMKTKRTIYHVFPWYYRNMEWRLGQYLGAMCILSLRKEEQC